MCDAGHTVNNRSTTAGPGSSFKLRLTVQSRIWEDRAMASGDRLTGLDSSFLHLEDGPAHMHVASTLVFEGPAPDYVEFRDHIESRLRLVPRFRQKLRFVPYAQGRPVWVDDPQFNLDYHVRHTALPEPDPSSSCARSRRASSANGSTAASRSGSCGSSTGSRGGRFAIVGKSHHCLVDGVSGMDITTVLFDTQSEPPPSPSPTSGRPGPSRPTPSCSAAPCSSARRRRPRPSRRPSPVPRPAQGGGRVGRLGSSRSAPWPGPASRRRPRRSTWRSARTAASRGQADLDQFKRIKKAAGGTVNDVCSRPSRALSGAICAPAGTRPRGSS